MAKLFIFRSVYVSVLTCGHERGVMNEKVKSGVQVTEIGFLQIISGLALLDMAESADTCEYLNTESLLFLIAPAHRNCNGSLRTL